MPGSDPEVPRRVQPKASAFAFLAFLLVADVAITLVAGGDLRTRGWIVAAGIAAALVILAWRGVQQRS
jgi:hypothetical protein